MALVARVVVHIAKHPSTKSVIAFTEKSKGGLYDGSSLIFSLCRIISPYNSSKEAKSKLE